ncbi:MAG TPA: VOC family protein [Rhizomicrobium sp.]|nr:VOC family protein [Rhizomicrobium sp.]
MSGISHSQVFRPSVNYQDDHAALEWLQKAFGFEPSLIVTDDGGKIVHAEMKFEGAEVMIAREWSDITRSPKSLGGKNTQQIHVQIASDIDAHCARARAAGATIVAEPADQFYGDRTYRALDPEGHLWTFGQQIKVLSLGEMEKASGLKLRETL